MTIPDGIPGNSKPPLSKAQKAGIGCGGCLSAFVALLLFAAACAPHSTSTTPVGKVSPTASASAGPSVSPSPSPTPTASPTASPTPVDTPTPASSAPADPVTHDPYTPPPALAPTTHTPAPVRTTEAPPQPTHAQAAGCSPLSSHGTCYKAGEFCPNADHGMTGTDANGNAIRCENNNGWRWEHA